MSNIPRDARKLIDGLVDRPGPHHDKGGLTQSLARGVELGMFPAFARVCLDLPDARDVIMEQRIQCRSLAALKAISVLRGDRVDERSRGEKRNGERGQWPRGWGCSRP